MYVLHSFQKLKAGPLATAPNMGSRMWCKSLLSIRSRVVEWAFLTITSPAFQHRRGRSRVYAIQRRGYAMRRTT
jgi:hypothetical protein